MPASTAGIPFKQRKQLIQPDLAARTSPCATPSPTSRYPSVGLHTLFPNPYSSRKYDDINLETVAELRNEMRSRAPPQPDRTPRHEGQGGRRDEGGRDRRSPSTAHHDDKRAGGQQQGREGKREGEGEGAGQGGRSGKGEQPRASPLRYEQDLDRSLDSLELELRKLDLTQHGLSGSGESERVMAKLISSHVAPRLDAAVRVAPTSIDDLKQRIQALVVRLFPPEPELAPHRPEDVLRWCEELDEATAELRQRALTLQSNAASRGRDLVAACSEHVARRFAEYGSR
ncbi:hypothetical protein JCM8208_004302 [Rhodotorula glutinis]